jgi:hypothetical protein
VEIPLRIEIPRNRIRKSAKDTREQVWDTILKREAVAIGHIHECDACAAPCDDPENQMVVPNGNEGSRIVEAHSRLDVLTEYLGSIPGFEDYYTALEVEALEDADLYDLEGDTDSKVDDRLSQTPGAVIASTKGDSVEAIPDDLIEAWFDDQVENWLDIYAGFQDACCQNAYNDGCSGNVCSGDGDDGCSGDGSSGNGSQEMDGNGSQEMDDGYSMCEYSSASFSALHSSVRYLIFFYTLLATVYFVLSRRCMMQPLIFLLLIVVRFT